MDKKTAQELIEKSFNNAFSEEQFTVFTKNLLNDLEDKDNRYSGNLIWDDYKEHINTYKRIGKYIDPDGEALDVLIVEVKSVTKLERARTALRNFVIKHLSKFEKDYALIAFYSKEDDGADWRFSFIKLEYRSELDEEKGKVKTKKEFTPAKRYSFLVGKYEKAHTAKNQLLPLLQNISNNPTIEELESAFSIEKVTGEFFNQYKDLYIKLYEHFENARTVKAAIKDAGIDNARFTKKLLGQIVFLYFLQKKGWLGVAQNARWGTGKKRFVQELNEQAQKENVNFFKDKLQYLFYEALAKERDNVNSYYKRFDCRIPFLNGGLFEADYNWQEANITIPENLFRNEEKNKSGDVGTGILDVFDRYNFTIKEDEPLDKEVAVDPEMLGKVFENMLDITERKSKGAFYTPREVVHYMCQESLIHYLDNAFNSGPSSYQELGSDQTKLFGGSAGRKRNLKIELEHTDNVRVPKKDIETFIREGHFALENDERVASKGETKTYQYQLPESIRKNADLIDKNLSNIKICDPAIGSGAFPVGLLHELVNAMLVLKSHLSYDYITEKLKGFGFTHRESINDSRYIYRLKRHIIQESIYGVDIDSSAIDIARLRLWLSLVVDEDDLDPIETLPNLDYKIVAGNSLIGLPDSAMRNLNVEYELEKLKEKFYNITDEKEKKALRKQINTKIRELLGSAEQFAGYKIDFDFRLYFSEVWREKGGFDVVIGNPPYVVDSTFDKWQKDFFIRNFKSAIYQINLYMLFMEQAFKVTKPNAFCTYIVPNTWLVNKVVAPFRKYLLQNFNLLSVVDLTEEQVFDATVLPIIFTARNSKPKSFVQIISGKGYRFQNLAKLSLDRIFNQPNLLINYQISDVDWDVLLKIEKNTLQLEEIAKSSFGVKFYQKGKGVPKQSESTVRNHSFTHEEAIDETCLNILEGKNIDRFYFEPSTKYIQYGKWLAEPRDEEMFIGERVLVRRIVGQSGLISVFVDGNYCNNSLLHVVKPFQKKSKAIASILNSEVLGYYFIKKFARKEKTFPEIRIHELNSLPISKLINVGLLEIFYDYINVSLVNKYDLLYSFFVSLNNSVIYELYFPEEIKSAGKEIQKHLGDLKPVTDDMSEENKLALIQREFERLYDPNHPARFAMETMDSVEEVRIIKDALR